MRIVITAGGTREYIDPVRYVTNASSGRMGYALATAASRKGHEVVLITAPTSLKPPANVELVKVVTSNDLFKAVRSQYWQCDCLIMAAAVSDYKPTVQVSKKIKKDQTPLTLELKPTRDILKWAGQKKSKQLLVGFALEDQNLLENAETKFKKKNLDMIVANAPTAIGAQKSSVNILTHKDNWMLMQNCTKTKIANKIIKLIECL